VSEIPADQRSPSPEPIFDRNGAVVNGRVSRRRKHLEEEKQRALDLLKPKVPQRQWRKLIVPVDKYPGYNFFGALIGPRGNAQKRMERESGCKIVIRGRGAIKEGCGRHDGKPLGPEDEEPMHVLIEGPDEETVEL
jgi:splicing factor 1